MATRFEEAFVNKYGHKIEPGDKVVVVVQGYNHRIRSYIGVYIGYVKSKWTLNGKEVRCAQVRTSDGGYWHGTSRETSRIATLQSNLIFPTPKEQNASV